ncbi:P-loop containing nucleoside triphosphate hydrolase protein [Podospora aff. communis PSN243]|uniref:P-loop containing nucleoside triphosphate hydrolase protein n=1 Tax=Podospora aff. communis PSN243 TaxID=3040156 RepID=A0AAV9GKZ0_9PEZI|nr:P-loop containing nucleoside triphosphate hydrolase protein [Podospora aff. communis PSN243]
MSNKPIFVATHPRACSTAFERAGLTRPQVFMTREDLNCIHEPFGDAFYFGPERLSERYADDAKAREESGFATTTFADVVRQLEAENTRVFIKDIIHYLFPPNKGPAQIAPSLRSQDAPQTNGTTNGTPNGTTNGTHHDPIPNPTVLPFYTLRKFHFTFLIRHPRRAIPSYYRCTIPPLSSKTGFHHFLPSESGYDELRRAFDFFRTTGLIGPRLSSSSPSDTPTKDEIRITVIDADDLLDYPEDVIRAYCKEVGLEFHPGMLKWEDEESKARAKEQFEKWNGFHEDAIGSTELKAREHRAKTPSREEEDESWREKYGEEAARMIRETVDANVEDYEYLRGFAMKF